MGKEKCEIIEPSNMLMTTSLFLSRFYIVHMYVTVFQNLMSHLKNVYYNILVV
jgi:hypothetical protein